jgi:energy-coupling factor transporter transmembrane protein EcfT
VLFPVIGPLFRATLGIHTPLFLFSMKSVDSLPQALEARGFGWTKKPTPYILDSPRAGDYAVIAASICLAVAAVLLRLLGFGEVISRL